MSKPERNDSEIELHLFGLPDGQPVKEETIPEDELEVLEKILAVLKEQSELIKKIDQEIIKMRELGQFTDEYIGSRYKRRAVLIKNILPLISEAGVDIASARSQYLQKVYKELFRYQNQAAAALYTADGEAKSLNYALAALLMPMVPNLKIGDPNSLERLVAEIEAKLLQSRNP